MMLNLYDDFWQKLRCTGISEAGLQQLIDGTQARLQNPGEGDYHRWYDAYRSLPDIKSIVLQKNRNAITCQSEVSRNELDQIRSAYQGLIPWRKGPFDMLSVYIDAEWQSNLKWQRIAQHLPNLTEKQILDVGCGNGYYLFRMSEQSPRLLMGIDPGLLQVMQFWSIEKYHQSGACVMPLSMQQMPNGLNHFDVVFSMGVLYHRKSPIHHIKELYDCIRPKGHMVIETLVVDGDEKTCLIPSGRYAQMRNVWFLPSIDCLSIMLKRCGFGRVSCVDVTTTTTHEQRSTDWMMFHSLKDFVDEQKNTTIEGYALPKRATLIAQKL